MLTGFNAALNINNFHKLDNYLEQKLFIIYPTSFTVYTYDEPQPKVNSEIKLLLLKNSRKRLNNEIKK